MSADWRAGALRGKGELLRILKTAADLGRTVKLELTQPKLDFGRDHQLVLVKAAVVRATDADLR